MTTNVGADQLSKNNIGFGLSEKNGSDVKSSIEKAFTPEFRNRIDAIIPFNPLSKKVVTKVVHKFIEELRTKLKTNKVKLTITDKAIDLLSLKGYEPAYGARPLSRIIQKYLKKPLSKEILFGRLVKGGEVKVDADTEGNFHLNYCES